MDYRNFALLPFGNDSCSIEDRPELLKPYNEYDTDWWHFSLRSRYIEPNYPYDSTPALWAWYRFRFIGAKFLRPKSITDLITKTLSGVAWVVFIAILAVYPLILALGIQSTSTSFSHLSRQAFNFLVQSALHRIDSHPWLGINFLIGIWLFFVSLVIGSALRAKILGAALARHIDHHTTFKEFEANEELSVIIGDSCTNPEESDCSTNYSSTFIDRYLPEHTLWYCSCDLDWNDIATLVGKITKIFIDSPKP